MLELIRNELARRPYLQETTLNDWQHWAEKYAHLVEPHRTTLSKMLTVHTGIPPNIADLALRQQQNPDFIQQLHFYEQQSSAKIQDFQTKTLFQRHDLSLLAITRSEWLALIKKFESLHRHHLNTLFLIEVLSSLRRVSFDSVLSLLKKEVLPRQAKADLAEKEIKPLKRKRSSFFKDEEEINPLIVDDKTTPSLQQALENTGVRFTSLSYASPEKGYSNLMSTASGKKVRPLCNVRGVLLFKPVTPYGKISEAVRADLREAASDAILSELPRLNNKRAEVVEFTATLDNIKERTGKRRRQSQSRIMGASATDVFQAHGIEVSYAHKKIHHWAHLIAHFLCDSSEISSDSEEAINLVASTAAANYNTLKIIELFIRNTLIDEGTEEIHIHVLPRFSGESLIPDQLIYTLNWNTVNAEGLVTPQTNVYYISPQSYERITKCMQASIEVLNQMTSDSQSSDTVPEDFDDSNIQLLF